MREILFRGRQADTGKWVYCDAYAWCVAMRQGGGLNTPNHWPDPEEGGGEDG